MGVYGRSFLWVLYRRTLRAYGRTLRALMGAKVYFTGVYRRLQALTGAKVCFTGAYGRLRASTGAYGRLRAQIQNMLRICNPGALFKIYSSTQKTYPN